jgi:Mrp family chromosome partitioning ATPase
MNRMKPESTAEAAGSLAFRPWRDAPEHRNKLDSRASICCLRRFGPQFTTLARRVARLGPSGLGTVALVVGCGPASGCSTVSLAMAAASARERATLLIDGDSLNPSMTELFGRDTQSAWLSDSAYAGVQPSRGTLAFLPLSAISAGGSTSVERLRRDFGLIVVDCGEWRVGTQELAQKADIAVLTCKSGKGAERAWMDCWDRLEDCGSQVLGIVETFTRTEAGSGAV